MDLGAGADRGCRDRREEPFGVALGLVGIEDPTDDPVRERRAERPHGGGVQHLRDDAVLGQRRRLGAATGVGLRVS